MKSLSALVIIFLSSVSYADMFTPHASCFKPFKPYEFTSEAQVDIFKMSLNEYQQCINEFIEEQEKAIKQHRKAANEAIEEWNNYVNYELK